MGKENHPKKRWELFNEWKNSPMKMKFILMIISNQIQNRLKSDYIIIDIWCPRSQVSWRSLHDLTNNNNNNKLCVHHIVSSQFHNYILSKSYNFFHGVQLVMKDILRFYLVKDLLPIQHCWTICIHYSSEKKFLYKSSC